MTARARVLSGVLAVGVLAAGCGHDVSPAPEFQDPASLPVCCATDFDAGCCDVAAAAYSYGILLSWFSEDEIFAFIDGWAVHRAQGETAPPDSAYRRLNAKLIQEREYMDRNVENEVEYWYRLTAVSPAGVESRPTRAASARADMTPPAPPSGLAALAVPGGAALDWNPSPEPDVLHYNVFREPPVPAAVFGPVPAAMPSYLDNLIGAGTTYHYWVTAVDRGFNESAPSDTVTVVFP